MKYHLKTFFAAIMYAIYFSPATFINLLIYSAITSACMKSSTNRYFFFCAYMWKLHFIHSVCQHLLLWRIFSIHCFQVYEGKQHLFNTAIRSSSSSAIIIRTPPVRSADGNCGEKVPADHPHARRKCYMKTTTTIIYSLFVFLVNCISFGNRERQVTFPVLFFIHSFWWQVYVDRGVKHKSLNKLPR